MNPKAKIALYVAIAVLAIVGVVWANFARLNSTVRNIDVQITYDCADTLVKPADVERLLLKQMPHIKAQLVKEVETDQVLRCIQKSPYLHQTQISVSMSRDIVIRTHQRTPIAQIFTGKSSFFIDSTATRMPLSEYSTPDVIVANYQDSTSKHSLAAISHVANFLHSHPEYADIFDQIYEEHNHDLYLVPKLGSHVVLLGDTNDLDTKFHNLITVYRKGMQKKGWDTYKLINLKYKGQVICRRKEVKK